MHLVIVWRSAAQKVFQNIYAEGRAGCAPVLLQRGTNPASQWKPHHTSSVERSRTRCDSNQKANKVYANGLSLPGVCNCFTVFRILCSFGCIFCPLDRPVLPFRQMPDRSRGSGSTVEEPARLLPVLHGSKHRQAPLRQHGQPTPPAQFHGLGKPPAASLGSGRTLAASHTTDLGQAQSLGPGKLAKGSRGSSTEQGWMPEEAGAFQADEDEHAGLQSLQGMPQGELGGDPLPSPPPPLPVKAHPYSRLTQQQQQQQQVDEQQYSAAQQSQHGAISGVDLIMQAKVSFQRSTSQQQSRGVETWGSRDAGVLLQACLHRFVRPETLHRWTCSR